jgi:holin-like protein
MVIALTLLLVFQLAGEALSRVSGLPVPGPVIGFALLALLLLRSPRTMRTVEPTANALLRHLSLLYVPAAVGIVQQIGRLRAEGVAIAAALLVSTAAALAVTALTFRAVERWTGTAEER